MCVLSVWVSTWNDVETFWKHSNGFYGMRKYLKRFVGWNVFVGWNLKPYDSHNQIKWLASGLWMHARVSMCFCDEEKTKIWKKDCVYVHWWISCAEHFQYSLFNRLLNFFSLFYRVLFYLNGRKEIWHIFKYIFIDRIIVIVILSSVFLHILFCSFRNYLLLFKMKASNLMGKWTWEFCANDWRNEFTLWIIWFYLIMENEHG